MKTIFGFDWPTPDLTQILIILLIIAVITAFLLLLRYNYILNRRIIHEQQLFLFKTKQLGLTNYQFKILSGVIENLGLKDPNKILDNAVYFESSIGSFLQYLRDKNENEESLSAICKDIIITYEKIYHFTTYKKPLETIHDIEDNILLCFVVENKDVYIGKLINKEENSITLQLFRHPRNLQNLAGKPIKGYIWRTGDAEYTFDAQIISNDTQFLNIVMPDTVVRGKEVRHPYIEVMLPCRLIPVKDGLPIAEQEKHKDVYGNIFKINENETVIRLNQSIDYKLNYIINFEISDFKMGITSKVIADKTIHEENTHYYTLKFMDISEAGARILKQFIVDHL